MQSSLHEMSSTSVPLPKLDLFGVPPTQTIIERDIVTEHRPIATIDPTSFIQFEIQTAIDEYIDLEKLILYMKVKLEKMKSVSTDAEWDNIAPTNYLLHSMIKQVDIFIGDKQITSNSPTYAYKAYFEAFLGFSRDQKKSHLTSALWYNDEDLKDDVIVKNQTKYLKNYRELDMMGRLHTDITFQGRSLLGGCKLTIRILLNDPKFYMISKGHKPELDIMEVSLFTHRSKVSRDLVEAHNLALDKATAKYPLTMSKVKAFTIHTGAYDACIDNIHSGQLPRRIFICFVRNSAYCGEYHLNPYRFEHCFISNITVYLDGIQFPTKAYTPDFESGIYQREMYSLYEALDMLDMDPNFYINRDNYAKGNTIFGFNFTPDLSSGCGTTGHLSSVRFGSLRLALRFNKTLVEPITALVYCEFDKILEIDSNRRAIIDSF